MDTPAFANLLQQAVTEPGTISKAYFAFHRYSFGNQLLAWAQCQQRGMTPGPLGTFMHWKTLGRHVTKGEKALTLCMPVTMKRKGEALAGADDRGEVFTRFIYKNHWFVLAQTAGLDVPASTIPAWDAESALTVLDILEIPFDLLDGNCQGFARERSIAINPVNPLPHKTRFHEIGHILLGHTTEGAQHDSEQTPRNLRECEAEAVALLCCAALDLPGVECSRGYIQSWWGAGNPIPERSAQKIFKTVDQILKAGSLEALS